MASTRTTSQPLAARMRPTSLDEIVGQEHLLRPGSALRRLAVDGAGPSSVVLWGPPGTGKTTIANAIASSTQQRFVELSATSAGVKEVRAALDAARAARAEGQATTLFLDEVHRFSKAQQDVLLPVVEDRTVTLIGATTENPSFSVNSALLSRALLLTLRPLTNDDVAALLDRAVADPRGLDGSIRLDDSARDAIADVASGDARRALTYLEATAASAVAQDLDTITVAVVEASIDRALARFDKNGDQHYDIISAFIKSMRGSDPQAALHWLARLIEGGEDPRYIARRLIVHASEDVGMADPTVLPIAIAAAHAVQLIGMPEARINLAQAAVAIALAPKSPGIINGIDRALTDVRAGRTGEVPMHLRDAHYPGAKALGHGVGYLFPHDFEHGLVAQQYLPDAARDAQYYSPTINGHEQLLSARLAAITSITHQKG